MYSILKFIIILEGDSSKIIANQINGFLHEFWFNVFISG